MESQMILQAIKDAEQRILAAISGSRLTDREIGQAARRYEEKAQIAEGAAVCDS